MTRFRTVFCTLIFALSAAAAAAQGLLGPSSNQDQFLPVDEAFVFTATADGGAQVALDWQIAPGYYLYRHRVSAKTPTTGFTLGEVAMPAGKKKTDEFFGDVEVYYDSLSATVPITRPADASTFEIAVSYQGCADAGLCYPPLTKTVTIEMPPPGTPARSDAVPMVAEQDRLASLIADGSLLVVMATFFGFGLLLAFTPCVLPMIPILSGIIVGRGQHLTRAHGLALSAVYVLGMALTYAVAGVAAGLSGAMLSAVLQSPWVLGGFAALFVVLALSMFGFYELQLPVALQSRLAEATNRLPGGQFAGVFSMGILSALIVGPCVAAPLAGALLYISQSRDVVLGGTALFTMALGMGVPLLAVGASAGTLVPKAGPWMESVKRFFGVVMLAVALYLIAPFLAVALQMLAWGMLLMMTAVYLRALDPLPATAHGFERFSKAVGVIALVAGAAFLVGALAGGRDVLQPLSGLRGGVPATGATPVVFQPVNNESELERAIKAAAGKPVMLDFYADWCVSCKEMERFTFPEPAVRERLQQMVTLKADVTANAAEHAALLRRFQLFGPPGIIFFDREGREIRGLRVIGFQGAEKFAGVLEQVIAFR